MELASMKEEALITDQINISAWKSYQKTESLQRSCKKHGE